MKTINSQISKIGMSRQAIVGMGILVCFLGWVVIKGIVIPKPLLIIMSVAAGLYLLFKGISKPEIVTYALVAYLPFSRELAGDFGGMAMAFNFTNILMVFMLWAWMSGRYAMNEPMWLRTPLNLPITLFLALGLAAVIRGNYFGPDYLGFAVIQYKRWITPILFYFLVLNTVKERGTVQNVAVIIIITTTVAALMAIYDYIDLGPRSSLEKSRIGGICEQPNQLAAFFTYYMFLPLGFFLLNMGRFSYWGLLIPFLLCFRGIMVTFSRGGYIACAAGIYAITFFRSKILMMLLIVATVVVYFNPIFLPAGIRYRMGQTVQKEPGLSLTVGEVQEGDLEPSAQQRIKIWKAGLEMVMDHPMWGVGYGLFPKTLVYYADVGERDAHNTYLILAAEMGIPALLVFLWILGLAVWKTRSLYLKTNDPFAKGLALGWLGGLFGLLMSNMFGSRLDSQEISSYFWILCALVMRLLILDKKEKEAGLGIKDSGLMNAKSNKLDACWGTNS